MVPWKLRSQEYRYISLTGNHLFIFMHFDTRLMAALSHKYVSVLTDFYLYIYIQPLKMHFYFTQKVLKKVDCTVFGLSYLHNSTVTRKTRLNKKYPYMSDLR